MCFRPASNRALDLDARSDADPEQLLASFSGQPPMSQSQAVNDLEPPAFGMCVLTARMPAGPMTTRKFNWPALSLPLQMTAASVNSSS